MTRETKIGLLVGLAFIIVIGILLSDHLSSAIEPPQAPLSQAGANVRQAVSVPGNATPPINIIAPEPAPQQPVPIKQDLAPKPQPVQIVQIGPSPSPTPLSTAESATESQVSETASPAEPQHVILTQEEASQIEETTSGGQSTAAIEPTAEMPQGELDQVARSMGEEIVRLGAETSAPQANAADPAVQGARQYKAQEGDSLSRMAARFYGANTKANRDLIISANRSLQKNPDIVVLGRTYMIPAPGSAPPQPVESASAITAADSMDYVYTVKSNDTLWGIARNQLGNPNALAAIKELNQDTLHGSDVIREGMKLRLPAKPIASAQ